MFGEGVEKSAMPRREVVASQRRQHRRVARATFAARHRERMAQRQGYGSGICRIHTQRRGQLAGGTGVLRQHQDAGICGILYRDELLRDQIHAVTQRRHARDARAPQQRECIVVRQSPFDQLQRIPVRRGVPLAQVGCQISQARTQRGLLRRVGTGRRENLQHVEPSAQCWHVIQQMGIGVQACLEPLARLQPVESRDQRIVCGICMAASCAGAQRIDVHADRPDAEPDPSRSEQHGTLRREGRLAFAERDGCAKVFEIARGLEADDVMSQQCIEQIVGAGHLAPLRGRRKGHVQEEAHGLRRAEPAQLAAQRQQMEIVYPDQVLAPQQGMQRVRVAPIDVAVGELLAGLHRSRWVDSMQPWPQPAIAEPQIEVAMFGATQRQRGELHARVAMHLRIRFAVVLHHRAVPPEPQSATRTQRGGQPDREAAGDGRHAWQRDAIRDDDEARHRLAASASSQPRTAAGSRRRCAAGTRMPTAMATPR